jgi:glutaryl-CoA dehydrogenase
MDHLWNDITEHLHSALEKAEKLGKDDLHTLSKIPEILSYLKGLDGEDMMLLLDHARKIKKRKHPEYKPINSDFFNCRNMLNPEEQKLLTDVQAGLRLEIAPIVDEAWMKGEFPRQIIDTLKKLDVCGLTYQGYGGKGKSFLLEGMLAEEIARVDVSTCTFFGAHGQLAMGSIYLCGSEEQKQYYLPKMQKFDLIGSFGLTEPDVGSAASMGLKTTCKREGDTWTINGQKKWIGNATFADLIIIWAKDVDDHQVKGFIVDRATQGLTTEKIEDKMCLRIVQNAIITLNNVKVKEERRLQNANSFKDTAKVLRMTRAGVAWQAVGCARGAYDNTLHYTMGRKQFDRPIAGFQMVQDLLAEMLCQITAMQTMVARLSVLQDQGTMLDEQASIAKVFCTTSCRSVTSHARELMGGNGILISNKVARFLADAEALYSYEGTKQINSLIVGRAITGWSAFV